MSVTTKITSLYTAAHNIWYLIYSDIATSNVLEVAMIVIVRELLNNVLIKLCFGFYDCTILSIGFKLNYIYKFWYTVNLLFFSNLLFTVYLL